MNKRKNWIVDAQLTSGTKFRFIFTIVIHLLVAAYIFVQFFTEINWGNWMLDATVFILGGLTPIYQAFLIRKLITEVSNNS